MVTKRQKQILNFLKKYNDRNGYSPSLEEIAEQLGLSSLSTIHYHLNKLEAEGLISRYDYLPRSIQIEESHNTPSIQIPLVGLIAAGDPIEAIENTEAISVPKSMISKGGAHYALKVQGDSMIDEGIFDGDVVIVHKQDVVENGDVIVALINNNEATLKKIYKEKNHFRLQPANPNLKPIYVKDLLVQGKVTGVLRTTQEEEDDDDTIKPLDIFSHEIEDQYSEKVPYAHRKQLGQFFTPFEVSELMTAWVLKDAPKKILDPACGTCVFERDIYRKTEKSVEVDAYDIDQKMLDIGERIAPALGTLNLHLFKQDFLMSDWGHKYDGIICNPPYLKHHHVKDKNKYIALARAKTGSPFSLNTNIYSLFTVKALSQLAEGGRMAFITPSEFLNANYGVEVKKHLLETKKWTHLIVFDFKMSVFNRATTTACITLFQNKPQDRERLTFIRIKNEYGLKEAKKLIEADNKESLDTDSVEVFVKPWNEINPAIKWRQYFKKQHQSSLLVPFTKYAKVMRGIATGANNYFTFSESDIQVHKIDQKYLLPCITKANHIPRNIFTEQDFKKLSRQDKKTYLLYVNGKNIDKNLRKYLNLGKKKKIDKKYLTSHRDPWWITENRDAAPILVLVFGRKGLRFVRNETKTRNLTCFHAIYPTHSGNEFIDPLMAFLVTDISQKVLGAEKREYGNGLEKFEPNDLNNGLIIDFERLPEKEISKIKNFYRQWRGATVKGSHDEAETHRKNLDEIFRGLLAKYKGVPKRKLNEQLSLEFA